MSISNDLDLSQTAPLTETEARAPTAPRADVDLLNSVAFYTNGHPNGPRRALLVTRPEDFPGAIAAIRAAQKANERYPIICVAPALAPGFRDALPAKERRYIYSNEVLGLIFVGGKNDTLGFTVHQTSEIDPLLADPDFDPLPLRVISVTEYEAQRDAEVLPVAVKALMGYVRQYYREHDNEDEGSFGHRLPSDRDVATWIARQGITEPAPATEPKKPAQTKSTRLGKSMVEQAARSVFEKYRQTAIAPSVRDIVDAMRDAGARGQDGKLLRAYRAYEAEPIDD